jgi:predicted nucleic acid-binding protein
MRLVVDANIVLGELLRERGRRLIAQPTLQFFMSEDAWEETNHELPRRLGRRQRRRDLSDGEVQRWLRIIADMIDARIQPIPQAVYLDWEAEARERIPRDPNDWPTVALALALDAAIWTADADFFGCGLPVWTTDSLSAHLRRVGLEL